MTAYCRICKSELVQRALVEEEVVNPMACPAMWWVCESCNLRFWPKDVVFAKAEVGLAR